MRLQISSKGKGKSGGARVITHLLVTIQDQTLYLLKIYDKKARIINIAVYSDDSFANPDWGKFSKMGDYVILTDPALPKTF